MDKLVVQADKARGLERNPYSRPEASNIPGALPHIGREAWQENGHQQNPHPKAFRTLMHHESPRPVEHATNTQSRPKRPITRP
jgi:hypothetical protein